MDKLSQMPDLIVFDVDGTLLNTIGDLQVSMNEILARHGFPVLSREEVRRLIGNGAREFMRLALPESARSVERVESMLAEYAAFYAGHNAQTTAVFEGALSLVEACKGEGARVAVLSNKPHPSTAAVIARYFPAQTFDAVMGQKPEFSPKPAPDALNALMREFGALPERTLMVGDGDADCRVSENAGCHYAGALWGYRTEAELLAAGARPGQLFAAPGLLADKIRSLGKRD